MRSPSLVLLLSLSAAMPALAGRWVTIADGHSRAVHLDTAGVQREGAQTRAWVREVYTQEQRSEQAGVLYYSTNTLTNYDCTMRTAAPLFRVFYGSDAMELRRIKLDAVEVPALVLPGSVNEQLLDKACEVADAQAKARQAARTKPAATAQPPGSASSAVSAAGPQDKAQGARPAETGQAGDKVAEIKDGEKGADASSAGQSQNSAPEKTGQTAAQVKPAPVGPADGTAGQAAAGKAGQQKSAQPAPDRQEAAASAPARKPAALPVTAGSAHGGQIQLPPIALARARAHGYAVPVNTEPARPSRPRTKPRPESAREDIAAKSGHADVHWGYTGAGAPENWGRLNSDFALCSAGTRQSPIDIREGARLDLEPIKFDYRPTPLRIVDNGRTIQVNYGEGSTIAVGGERFALEQFHFHKPAEERIDGRWFDMAAHLVHKSMEGRLAVVTVLFEMREQPNAFLRSLWPHLPMETGREVAMHEVMIDVAKLLPETRTYFTYMGSLTTPPCREGVRWIVLKTPVEVSFDQVAVFSKLYSMNARPIQPSHGRLIKESM